MPGERADLRLECLKLAVASLPAGASLEDVGMRQQQFIDMALPPAERFGGAGAKLPLDDAVAFLQAATRANVYALCRIEGDRLLAYEHRLEAVIVVGAAAPGASASSPPDPDAGSRSGIRPCGPAP